MRHGLEKKKSLWDKYLRKHEAGADPWDKEGLVTSRASIFHLNFRGQR
jgi:hypothetical protein